MLPTAIATATAAAIRRRRRVRRGAIQARATGTARNRNGVSQRSFMLSTEAARTISKTNEAASPRARVRSRRTCSETCQVGFPSRSGARAINPIRSAGSRAKLSRALPTADKLSSAPVEGSKPSFALRASTASPFNAIQIRFGATSRNDRPRAHTVRRSSNAGRAAGNSRAARRRPSGRKTALCLDRAQAASAAPNSQ